MNELENFFKEVFLAVYSKEKFGVMISMIGFMWDVFEREGACGLKKIDAHTVRGNTVKDTLPYTLALLSEVTSFV